MSRWLVRKVFRGFKALEHVADKVAGAAGPFFVLFAITLISLGGFAFFDTVLPVLPYKPLTVPLCLLIYTNLVGSYVNVLTVPPGFVNEPPRVRGTGFMWAKRPDGAKDRALTRCNDSVKVTEATMTMCTKCDAMRPERAHHCRICKTCVMKYDHHCPVRINQCVGIHNERYFVLFLVWLEISTAAYVAFGVPVFWQALMLFDNEPWPHQTHPLVLLLTYILSGVLCFAISAMASWHLYMIATGVTSIETHDHEQYRRMAIQRGLTFVNSYDLGAARNLELFFNLGKGGYPWYTLLLPFRVEPYTDGRAWARKPGYEQHYGIRTEEELTDDEEETSTPEPNAEPTSKSDRDHITNVPNAVESSNSYICMLNA